MSQGATKRQWLHSWPPNLVVEVAGYSQDPRKLMMETAEGPTGLERLQTLLSNLTGPKLQKFALNIGVMGINSRTRHVTQSACAADCFVVGFRPRHFKDCLAARGASQHHSAACQCLALRRSIDAELNLVSAG